MSYTSSPHDVKAGLGHNSGAFEQAVERFETAGFLLAKYETLCRAIRDRRLPRGTLHVLAELIENINRETMTTWLGRQAISERTGFDVRTVSNHLSQLKALGYIVSERRSTPQADNRVLLHYTLSALSPEEIEDAISRTVQSLRGQRNSVLPMPKTSPRVVKSQGQEITTGSDITTDDDITTGSEVITGGDETSPPAVKNTSPPAVHSNLANKPSNYNHLARTSAPAHTRGGQSYWSQAISGTPDADRIEIRPDGSVSLVGAERADWLERFEGDADRLDLAVMEIHIQANSLISPLVQARKQLARIAGQKRDGDRRYKAAAKRNETQRAAPASPEASAAERRKRSRQITAQVEVKLIREKGGEPHPDLVAIAEGRA